MSGLALICLMAVTAEALHVREAHIRERLIVNNAR
jgi:hypothetical protein